MEIKQISIFVENKPGRMANITGVLAAANIDIRALSLADTSDFGILRLIVNKPNEAVAALKAANITSSLTDVIGVSIADKPGAFAEVLDMMGKAEINVEYMYAFITRNTNKAFVIIRVPDIAAATKVLNNNGVELLSAEQVHGM